MSTEEFSEIWKKVGNVEFAQQEMKLKRKTFCKKFTEHRKLVVGRLSSINVKKKN